MKALHESSHPYYCVSGCYFSKECHSSFESWQAFKVGPSMYGADEDLNLLFRWDWQEGTDNELDPGEAQIELRYFLQRKGYPFSVTVNVTRADEPEIRVWLADKWRHLQRLWTPFAPDIENDVSDKERHEATLVHYATLAQESP